MSISETVLCRPGYRVKALLFTGFTMAQGLLVKTSVDWDGNFDKSTVAVSVVPAINIPPAATAAAAAARFFGVLFCSRPL